VLTAIEVKNAKPWSRAVPDGAAERFAVLSCTGAERRQEAGFRYRLGFHCFLGAGSRHGCGTAGAVQDDDDEGSPGSWIRESYGTRLLQQLYRWAAEKARFPKEVVDKALAHKLVNRVEAAYHRTGFFERRRRLTLSWAECLGQKLPTSGAPSSTARRSSREIISR